MRASGRATTTHDGVGVVVVAEKKTMTSKNQVTSPLLDLEERFAMAQRRIREESQKVVNYHHQVAALN